MSAYRAIYLKLLESDSSVQKSFPGGPLVRLLKVQEEAGEAAQAAIAFYGANPRKTAWPVHTSAVASELADVIVSAMVALHDWADDPNSFLVDHLDKLMQRVNEEGS